VGLIGLFGIAVQNGFVLVPQTRSFSGFCRFWLHGKEIERPPAIVMPGGLLTSTIFILLVLPTIYPWFAGRTKIAKDERALAGRGGWSETAVATPHKMRNRDREMGARARVVTAQPLAVPPAPSTRLDPLGSAPELLVLRGSGEGSESVSFWEEKISEGTLLCAEAVPGDET